MLFFVNSVEDNFNGDESLKQKAERKGLQTSRCVHQKRGHIGCLKQTARSFYLRYLPTYKLKTQKKAHWIWRGVSEPHKDKF
jgi:hypothetical protein